MMMHSNTPWYLNLQVLPIYLKNKKKKKTGKQNMDEHIFLSNLKLMKHSPLFSFFPSSSSFPKFDRTQIKNYDQKRTLTWLANIPNAGSAIARSRCKDISVPWIPRSRIYTISMLFKSPKASRSIDRPKLNRVVPRTRQEGVLSYDIIVHRVNFP